MPFINDQLKANAEVIFQKAEPQTRFVFKVSQVMEQLRSTIFGQNHVLQSIENMLRVVKADIGDPYRPLYVAMFLGPTGVGKTETVRTLAKAIHGDPDHFCRIDMNTLSQEHYAAALTGAPPGYVGSKEGTSLFQKDIVEGTFSKPGIVLFDEIEKASSEVIQALLNVFDNGVLILSSGEQVIDFRNSMIFITTNIGSHQMRQFANRALRTLLHRFWLRVNPKNWGLHEDVLLQKIITNSLEQEFAAEFINRIDDTLIFQWLKRETLDDIVGVLINQLNERLKKKSYQLEVEPDVKSLLMEKGFDQKYGARQLKRSIRRHLEVPVAVALGEGNQNGETMTVLFAFLKEGKITVVSKERGT